MDVGLTYDCGADIGNVDNTRNVALDRGTRQEEVDLVVVVPCEENTHQHGFHFPSERSAKTDRISSGIQSHEDKSGGKQP